MAISMTGVIVVTAAFCGLVALLLHHFRRGRLYIEAAKFPGPSAWMNIFYIVGYGLGKSDYILNQFTTMLNLYSSPFKLWFAYKFVIVISDPEQLKTVLNSPYALEKSDIYRFLSSCMGTGLLTAPAAKWRSHRKLIMPAFHTSVLKSFVEVFVRQSEVMTKRMRKELDAGEFGIYRYVSLCVQDITCETIMGVKMKGQLGGNSRYRYAVASIFKTISKRFLRMWLHSDFIFNLTKMGRDYSEHLKYFHGTINNVIQMKKHSYKNESRVENNGVDELPAARKSFLDWLLEVSVVNMKLTDEEFRDEVYTMAIGASHTTAMLSMFVIVILANKPEIQDRAYRELCDIYGDQVSSETPINNEDLNRMTYLERVIKETLRLFPISPILMRKTTADINIGKYTLPNGITVCIPLIHIHRSEKYWPDPLKFDPDRFLSEEVAKRHPCCFIPFSIGPRNCIGIKFAMMAIKVIVATVLRRYVLKKDKTLDVNDIKLEADFLKPVSTMTLGISERVNENIRK